MVQRDSLTIAGKNPMKILKRIVIILITFLIVSSVSGYLYFDKKFSPPENYLILEGACDLPILWKASESSPISALLLPVKIKNIPSQFYMQLDFGSPVTAFYSRSLRSIEEKYPNEISYSENLAELNWDFQMGKMSISSNRFKILNYGEPADWDNLEAENIIGTIGTDLLEKRTTILNLRDNVCSFHESLPDSITRNGLSDFQSKKRRILLPAKIDGDDVSLLFDSGTSAYELITSKENW